MDFSARFIEVSDCCKVSRMSLILLHKVITACCKYCAYVFRISLEAEAEIFCEYLSNIVFICEKQVRAGLPLR